MIMSPTPMDVQAIFFPLSSTDTEVKMNKLFVYYYHVFIGSSALLYQVLQSTWEQTIINSYYQHWVIYQFSGLLELFILYLLRISEME